METIFVDSHYLVAIINKRDQSHVSAMRFSRDSGNAYFFVATDSVIVETLNYFAEFRPDVKELAAAVIEDFSFQLNVKLVEQNSALVDAGINLYKSRLDKGYSLTDCISMNVSRQFGITKILTHDDHFRQEGFQILL